jgi:hypothetical protein
VTSTKLTKDQTNSIIFSALAAEANLRFSLVLQMRGHIESHRPPSSLFITRRSITFVFILLNTDQDRVFEEW